MMARAECQNFLRVENLSVDFDTPSGRFAALRSINLTGTPAGSICILGASGAGKSTLGRALLGLLPKGARHRGFWSLPGCVPTNTDNAALREYRRTSVGVIFQDAVGSLVPSVPIGRQLCQVFGFRRQLKSAEAVVETKAALMRVGLPDHQRIWGARPNELSGGMCQKIMICMALAAPGPVRILIADEPLNSLDSISAAQVLEILLSLQRDMHFTLLFITHDVRLASHFKSVAVLSHGELVGYQETGEFLRAPSSKEGVELLEASHSLGVPGHNP